MFDLEAGYVKFGDFCQTWLNKVATVDAEKVAVLEQLRLAAEWETKFRQEVSYLTDDLKSSRAELESARQNILVLELRVKSKKYSIHRLRRERDRCIAELEGKHVDQPRKVNTGQRGVIFCTSRC